MEYLEALSSDIMVSKDDIRSGIDSAVNTNYTLEECTEAGRTCFRNYQKTMLGLVEDGDASNTELGMLFCEGMDGKISIGRMCSGTSCSVELVDCVPHKMIGGFHIHPSTGEWANVSPERIRRELSAPSVADITNMITRHFKFTMIGSRGGIRCFVPDYSHPDMHKMSDGMRRTECVHAFQRLALKLLFMQEKPPNIPIDYIANTQKFAYMPGQDVDHDTLDTCLPAIKAYATVFGMMRRYDEIMENCKIAMRIHNRRLGAEKVYEGLYREIELW